MHDMQWDDLYVTPQEFIDMLTVAAKDSMYFRESWDRPMHPEDIFYNMDSVLEGMGNGLAIYLGRVGARVRSRKQTVPVFGGTVPKDDYDAKIKEVVNRIKNKGYAAGDYIAPSYTGNNV